MKHLNNPFGVEAAASSDFLNIRYINADLGEGKPYGKIATVHYREELSLDENLATAVLLGAAQEMKAALDQCHEILLQLQRHPYDAKKIIGESSFSQAYKDSSRVLEKVNKAIAAGDEQLHEAKPATRIKPF